MVTLSDIIARPDGLGGAGRERVLRCVRGCMDEFGHAADAPAVLAVAPGRVELCGNHTDHQRGRVLCAAAGPDLPVLYLHTFGQEGREV